MDVTARHALGRTFACVLAFVVLTAGCRTPASMAARDLAPLGRGQPVADEVIARGAAAAPNDATWLFLEQAFALLHSARSDDDVARAQSHLESAFSSFEDLRDPVNLSVAFTADVDTPYRGRPHERVLAATTLALTDAAAGRCDLALPTLKSAEFLDVRWQRLAFGTDASVVYALAVYCLEQTDGRPEDKQRAQDGLRLTLRYGAAAEAAHVLVDDAARAVPRPDAVAAMLARELFELGLLTALANNPRANGVDEILAAGKDASTALVRRVDEMLAMAEFNEALDVAREAAGGKIGKDTAGARAFVKNHLKPALDELAQVLRTPPSDNTAITAFAAAIADADVVAEAALRQLRSSRVQFSFSGAGPIIVREGTYKEVARILPRDDAPSTPGLRTADADADADVSACGIRGTRSGFVVVLCGKRGHEPATDASAELEVWSSSTQATTVVGRRFDAILKGRAAFKAGTEAAARVAAFTALSLWDTGFDMLAACAGASPRADKPAPTSKTVRKGTGKGGKGNTAPPPRQKGSGDEACYAVAGTILAAGAVVAGVGGVVWLAGATVNPAADPRYVNALPETVALLVPGLPHRPNDDGAGDATLGGVAGEDDDGAAADNSKGDTPTAAAEEK